MIQLQRVLIISQGILSTVGMRLEPMINSSLESVTRTGYQYIETKVNSLTANCYPSHCVLKKMSHFLISFSLFFKLNTAIERKLLRCIINFYSFDILGINFCPTTLI